MRRGIVVLLVGALLGSVATAKPDPKAQRLAVQGKKLLDATDEPWRRFWGKPEAFPEAELKGLVKKFGEAVDALNASLDIEERPGLVKVIMLITRKQRMVIFEQMRRTKKARDAASEKKKPKRDEKEPKQEKPQRGDDDPPNADAAAEDDAADDAGDDDGGIEDGRDEESSRRRRSPSEIPEWIETKSQRRNAINRLRTFVLKHGSNRRVENLLDKCGHCNGRGRRRTGRINKRNRNITVPCKLCNECGWLLNEPILRRTHWVAKSPLYRSVFENWTKYEELRDQWKENPRLIPEFIKNVKILDVDYKGLWAVVRYREKGKMTESRQSFERVRLDKFIRIGKRWFFYDEEFDRGFFDAYQPEDDAAADDDLQGDD